MESPKQNSADGYQEAYRALNQAIEALRRCLPHDRDNYQGDDAFYKARDEHQKRIKTIQSVKEELLYLYLGTCVKAE